MFDPLCKIGIEWLGLKKHSNAYFYFKKSIEVYDRFATSVSPSEGGRTLQLMGRVCKDLKLKDKADEFFLRALKVQKEGKVASHQIASTLNDLGQFQFERNNLYSADNFFRQALNEAKRAQRPDFVSKISKNIKILNDSLQ